MSFDLENANAGYVVAAYAVAGVALIGLLVTSMLAWRRRQKEWAALQSRKGRAPT